MFKFTTKNLVLMSLFVALLCVSSLIVIHLPISPTPITLQTLFINIIALIFTPVESGITIFVYLLLGLIGLPVFSGGTGGIGRLLGPTGGYLIGYWISAILISVAKGKSKNLVRYILCTILIGIPTIYLLGNISMCLYLNEPYHKTFLISTIPYLPGDLVKCIAGAYIAWILKKRVLN